LCIMVYKRLLKNKLTRHLNVKVVSPCNEWRMLLSPEIALLLEILGDGKWHELAELQQQAGLAEYKVHGIAEFLCRFDFAVVDETHKKVKVNRDFQEFLTRT
jgi:hypothetical protein